MKVPIKLLLDENVERRLLMYLQRLGYDATKVGIDYPHQLSDQEVLTLATKEDRVLITNDRSDFGELIFHQQQPHCGVILFRRIRSGEITTKIAQLQLVLTEYAEHLRSFIVVEANRIRVRRNLEDMAA